MSLLQRSHVAQLCTAVLLLCSASTVQPHDVWLRVLPSDPTPDSESHIGLAIGHYGEVEPLAFTPSRIVSLWRRYADAEQRLEPATSTTFLTLPVGKPGVYSVGYIGNPAMSELPPAKFDAYLKEKHLDAIIALRRQQPPSAVVREHYSRALKAVVVAGEGALVDCPIGLPLEISVEATTDGKVQLRARFEDAPLGGLWVELKRPDATVLDAAATDHEGRVRLSAAEGELIASGTHMLASPDASVHWRSWWASTTFHVGAGRIEPCAG